MCKALEVLIHVCVIFCFLLITVLCSLFSTWAPIPSSSHYFTPYDPLRKNQNSYFFLSLSHCPEFNWFLAKFNNASLNIQEGGFPSVGPLLVLKFLSHDWFQTWVSENGKLAFPLQQDVSAVDITILSAEPSPPGMETNIGALGAIRTRLFLLCGNELNPLKGSDVRDQSIYCAK